MLECSKSYCVKMRGREMHGPNTCNQWSGSRSNRVQTRASSTT